MSSQQHQPELGHTPVLHRKYEFADIFEEIRENMESTLSDFT